MGRSAARMLCSACTLLGHPEHRGVAKAVDLHVNDGAVGRSSAQCRGQQGEGQRLPCGHPGKWWVRRVVLVRNGTSQQREDGVRLRQRPRTWLVAGSHTISGQLRCCGATQEMLRHGLPDGGSLPFVMGRLARIGWVVWFLLAGVGCSGDGEDNSGAGTAGQGSEAGGAVGSGGTGQGGNGTGGSEAGAGDVGGATAGAAETGGEASGAGGSAGSGVGGAANGGGAVGGEAGAGAGGLPSGGGSGGASIGGESGQAGGGASAGGASGGVSGQGAGGTTQGGSAGNSGAGTAGSGIGGLAEGCLSVVVSPETVTYRNPLTGGLNAGPA